MTTTTTAQATTPASPTTRTSPSTLTDAFRLFRRKKSVLIMAAVVAATVAARIWVGGFTVYDLAVVAAFALYQPFQEWLIHVYILHWRPKRILGVVVDPAIARKHRRHHEDPADLDTIFIPLRVIPGTLALNFALWSLVMPTWGLALTAVGTLVLFGIVYEWTHFLIHTSYAPRTRFYRGIWRLHRLHHFKNENYWFGVTNHLGDRVLGTRPDPKDVPLSPTARTLGVAM